MKLLLSIILLIPGVSFAQYSLDSILLQLDAAITNHAIYTKEKEESIRNLKLQVTALHLNTVEEYDLNTQLYREYRPYICDSAIHYLNRNIDIATYLSDIERLCASKLELASLMSSAGMYIESVDIIRTIDRSRLPKHLFIKYYETYTHVYSELAYYTQDNRGSWRYRRIAHLYRDTLRNLVTPDNELYYTLKEDDLRNSGQWKEAFEINNLLSKKYVLGTREFAISSYNRSLICRIAGDVEGVKYYLALSALSDILSATKDHASLWMLAEILYNEKDITRAYEYIRFSWNETVFYNARLRSLQSAVILSLIDKTYQAKIEMQSNKLQNYLYITGVLVLLLLIAVFFIYRQMKKISVTRRFLEEANTNLQHLNSELRLVNEELQSVNFELLESNHIKEEYIGHFIKLCSTYIDKLDVFRRMVNKKINKGQTTELLKITGSQELIEAETQELYVNFDKAFLRIFPDFVARVNELLNEREKIVLENGELLNTDLRILALIRLGISNSSQIADFLRYSVNTIYNYRAKVKNRAISRDNFEELIERIR